MGQGGDFAASLLPHPFQEKLKAPCERQNTFGMLEINKGPRVGWKDGKDHLGLGCGDLSNAGKNTSNKGGKKISFLLFYH